MLFLDRLVVTGFGVESWSFSGIKFSFFGDSLRFGLMLFLDRLALAGFGADS